MPWLKRQWRSRDVMSSRSFVARDVSVYFVMTAMRSRHAFRGEWVSSHWHHLWCLWSSDWLCIVVIGSSEIIHFDWLALTSFLPCSWPSFTSWLCSISPSPPLGRATLPSLVRTHGSPGKSIYPLSSLLTPSKHPPSLQWRSRVSPQIFTDSHVSLRRWPHSIGIYIVEDANKRNAKGLDLVCYQQCGESAAEIFIIQSMA